jgi:lipopolysaccharide export system protein LptC
LPKGASLRGALQPCIGVNMSISLESVINPLDPQPSLPPRPRLPWYASAMQLISAYLPILLMAVLALFTWWLVQHTPRFDAASEPGVVRHEPDYVMQGARLQRFAADGHLRVQVEGRQMRHYPDSDTIEIDEVTIRAIGDDGSVIVATARMALANGDASEVQLRGGAHVVREAWRDSPAIEFDGEFVHALLTTEQIRSPLPVRIRQGASEMRVGGFEYDNLARSARLEPPVRARFDAPARR